MSYGDGVERPFIDGQNHTKTCRVWDGYYWYEACNCGAVATPATVILAGYSNYEVLETEEVRDLNTGRLLRHANNRNAVTITDDWGEKHIWNVWELTRRAFATENV